MTAQKGQKQSGQSGRGNLKNDYYLIWYEQKSCRQKSLSPAVFEVFKNSDTLTFVETKFFFFFVIFWRIAFSGPQQI